MCIDKSFHKNIVIEEMKLFTACPSKAISYLRDDKPVGICK